MTAGDNASAAPRVWSDAELAREAQLALDEFVERRLAEPGGRYIEHLNPDIPDECGFPCTGRSNLA